MHLTEETSAVTAVATVAPRNFYSFTLEQLEAYLKQYGKEKFRAQQIFKWVYEQRVTDFDLMLNLSKNFYSTWVMAIQSKRLLFRLMTV